MASRWRSAATLGVLLLTSCASTRTIPADTQTLLAAALTPDSHVAFVDVGALGAAVSYQEEGGLKIVSLSSTAAPRIAGNRHHPSRSGDGFDARLIVETAKNLAATYKDDNQSTFARALSASATAITTTCGSPISPTVSISSSVNGHPLTVLSGDWTLDNLKVLWSDLSVVVPDAKVTQILLYEDHVVFGFVSAMTACPVVWWTRSFNGTTSARCMSAFTGDLVDTTRFSPQRMLDAVSTAGESLPSASPQSVQVLAYPDSLKVALVRATSSASLRSRHDRPASAPGGHVNQLTDDHDILTVRTCGMDVEPGIGHAACLWTEREPTQRYPQSPGPRDDDPERCVRSGSHPAL